MLDYNFIFTNSVPIYIFFLIFWIKNKKKYIAIFFSTLLYFYVVATMWITLFPLPVDISLIESTKQVRYLETNNFIPFTFVSDAIL